MISIVLNSTNRSKRRQEKFINPLPLPEIQENTEYHFSLYSKPMLNLIKNLFYYKKRKNIFCISQAWLASRCGITREWANKLLATLEEQGIIKMMYQFKKKSYYRVSSFFSDEIIASLAHLWRAWPLAFLVSNPAASLISKKSSHLLDRKDIYIKSRTVTESSKHVRAREDGTDSFKKTERVMLLPSEKRTILEQLSQGIVPANFPSESVRNLTIVQLSKYGQVKLSAFPDHILKEAENKAKKMMHLKNPFAYLFTTCVQLCREKNIEIDFQWVDALKRTLKMDGSCSPVIVQAVRPSTTLKQKLDSQWKPDRTDINPETELENAKSQMQEIAFKNPMLAFILGDLFKKLPNE